MDQIKPETTIDSGPSGTITTSQADFAFSSNKSPAQFFCSIDGADAEACASTKTYTGLSDGQHEFRVYAGTSSATRTRPGLPDLHGRHPGPVDPPSNAFTFGRLKLNTKQGTATLQVKVPGAGNCNCSARRLLPPVRSRPGRNRPSPLAVKARAGRRPSRRGSRSASRSRSGSPDRWHREDHDEDREAGQEEDRKVAPVTSPGMSTS